MRLTNWAAGSRAGSGRLWAPESHSMPNSRRNALERSSAKAIARVAFCSWGWAGPPAPLAPDGPASRWKIG
ncbi:hypothetical protein D3C72_1399080 [compost metagenome]